MEKKKRTELNFKSKLRKMILVKTLIVKLWSHFIENPPFQDNSKDNDLNFVKC